jgi:hypothetical protein
MAPCQAGIDVHILLLLLLLGQDLVRSLASVVQSLGIRDANVEDSPCSAPPESVDGNVTSDIRWRLCALSCCSCVAAPA